MLSFQPQPKRRLNTRDEDGLGDDDASSKSDDEQRPGRNDPEVQQHSDREEEQPEQDRSEWLDVAFKFVPVGRFGKDDAGDEGAERGRQPEVVHEGGSADDGEQAGDDEQLALADAADETEQGIEDEPAEGDQPDDREQACKAQASSRSARSGRAPPAPSRR